MQFKPVLKMLTLMAGIAMAAASQAERVYTVAIVPQQPPLVTRRNWLPLLHHISASTGIRFRLQLYRNIPAFERALLRGEADIAYMNPWHQVMANEKQGYMPLLRDGKRKLVGILVARKGSGISKLSDLNGKSIGFPAPNAFGASLYMRALLTNREGIRFDSQYFRTHTNVYRNVLYGTVSAGGGVQRTLNAEPAKLRLGVRIIYRTPGVAPHPVGVHRRVPAAVREKLVRAILLMARSGKDVGLLKRIKMTSPVRANYQRDYAGLKALGLESFYVKP